MVPLDCFVVVLAIEVNVSQRVVGKLMLFVEFDAFLEAIDRLFVLLFDCVDLSKAVISGDIVRTHCQALSVPTDCLVLLSFSGCEQISKAEVSIDIIFIELDGFLEEIDCLVVLSSFLIDESKVVVRNFIGRMAFNALLEEFYGFIELLFNFERKAQSVVDSWVVFEN